LVVNLEVIVIVVYKVVIVTIINFLWDIHVQCCHMTHSVNLCLVPVTWEMPVRLSWVVSVSASHPQGGADGTQRVGHTVWYVVLCGGWHPRRRATQGESLLAGRGEVQTIHC